MEPRSIASSALLRQQIPEDLIIARTSDQPLQVEENIELFMHALYEAIVLVVLIAMHGLLGVAFGGR